MCHSAYRFFLPTFTCTRQG
uniref:Uncharacterized protein n=1 Tax=Anguilla anguilla TaxID=7936 RepID=A0A0E9V2Y4_ANGAN